MKPLWSFIFIPLCCGPNFLSGILPGPCWRVPVQHSPAIRERQLLFKVCCGAIPAPPHTTTVMLSGIYIIHKYLINCEISKWTVTLVVKSRLEHFNGYTSSSSCPCIVDFMSYHLVYNNSFQGTVLQSLLFDYIIYKSWHYTSHLTCVIVWFSWETLIQRAELGFLLSPNSSLEISYHDEVDGNWK